MIIRNIRDVRENGDYRLLADVVLESRPHSETLFISVPEEHAQWFHPTPHAFLTGGIMAALWHGESAITVEGRVDEVLVERLKLAMRFMRQGQRVATPLPEIHALTSAAPWRDSGQLATAIFLSGGVDSTAALYRNASRYPVGDPRRIKLAFFVHGLDVGDPNKMNRADVWDKGIWKLTELCSALEVTLVPVRTNLRNLEKNWRFYSKWQFGSVLAAIAHAAGHRIFRCIISPDNDLEHTQNPHGSHPWMNHFYGSDHLEIVTGDMEQFSRLDKIRILAAYPAHLGALRVCWDTGAIPAGHLNCGRCSKCIRTMLEFLACGQPAGFKAFPANEATPGMVRSVHIRSHVELEYFEELLEPLESIGRQDLAAIVRRKLWLFNTEHQLGLNHLRPIARRLLGRN